MLRVACNVLSILTSSTPSKRLFSQAGLLSSHQFSRVMPKSLGVNGPGQINLKKRLEKIAVSWIS
jgi:hypothetical protein